MHREQKGEGGNRGNLVEKKESQKGERLFLCMVLESVLVSFFWGWCTGTTQRDGMGREEGGGFRMGNTRIPVVDSF